MSLSWAGKARKLPPIPVETYESKEQYPGWKLLDTDDHYSLIWPPEYAPEPAAVDFLRAFHPEVVPIFRKQLWTPPNSREVVVAGHWCFGRYVWYPGHQFVPLKLEVPVDWVGPVPNWIDCAFDEKDPREDGPAPYWPFDMRMAHRCREGYTDGFDQFTVAEKFRRIRERRREMAEKAQREAREASNELNEYVYRKMENFTAADAAEHYARMARKRAEKQATGHTRPFVALGG